MINKIKQNIRQNFEFGIASEILKVIEIIQKKICNEICFPLLHEMVCLKI